VFYAWERVIWKVGLNLTDDEVLTVVRYPEVHGIPGTPELRDGTAP
jgi:hypothetical protein